LHFLYCAIYLKGHLISMAGENMLGTKETLVSDIDNNDDGEHT
jgi:hypothetical protein